jgi:hypothetical protein
MSSMTYRSPLLDLPGAVAAEAPDTGVAAHYGSFNVEQRQLVADEGFVDLSHRPVLRISGPDRLTWLHSLTSQWFEAIPAGRYTQALILSPQGHVEHYFAGVDDGEAFIAHTEPGGLEPLVTWLNQMKFMTRVEVTDAGDDFALVWRRGEHHFIPRADLRDYAAVAGVPCGLWAYEALRIAAGNARMGLDTDHRSIPNEMGWLGSAVHLEKGCYRGQETVARVHTLGRPPRRLTLLHFDGSENRMPDVGAEIHLDGRVVGRMGTSARHFEFGPIGLGLVKRSVPLEATLSVDGLVATQEVVVDPEIGLHVRARL